MCKNVIEAPNEKLMIPYRYPHIAALKSLTLDDMHFLLTLHGSGSLSQTAKLFEVSVASASRRLAQCRLIFGDELFIRSGQRMVPTRQMENIVTHLRTILTHTEQLVVRNEDYCLTGEVRPARIIATDSGMASIVSSFVEPFYRHVPRSQLSILPYSQQCLEQLRHGDADLVFLPEGMSLPPDFHFQTLYETDYVIMAREGHPLVAHYESQGYLTLSNVRTERAIRIVTATQGSSVPYPLDIKVGMHTPYFLSVPDLLSKTELIFVSPRTMVERFMNMGERLVAMPIPEVQARFSPMMVWHHSTMFDPFYQWLRQVILEASRHCARRCMELNFAPILADKALTKMELG